VRKQHREIVPAVAFRKAMDRTERGDWRTRSGAAPCNRPTTTPSWGGARCGSATCRGAVIRSRFEGVVGLRGTTAQPLHRVESARPLPVRRGLMQLSDSLIKRSHGGATVAGNTGVTRADPAHLSTASLRHPAQPLPHTND
jgi:hypothetical protein